MRRAQERKSDLEQFLRRLHALGADQEQLDEVRKNWDNFDGEDWTPEIRAELVASPDVDLRAMIVAVNEEHVEHTMTDEELAAAQGAEAMDRAHADAYERMGLPVAKLLEWVGDDMYRAVAVSNLERGPEGGQRKTLLAEIDKVLGAS